MSDIKKVQIGANLPIQALEMESINVKKGEQKVLMISRHAPKVPGAYNWRGLFKSGDNLNLPHFAKECSGDTKKCETWLLETVFPPQADKAKEAGLASVGVKRGKTKENLVPIKVGDLVPSMAQVGPEVATWMEKTMQTLQEKRFSGSATTSSTSTTGQSAIESPISLTAFSSPVDRVIHSAYSKVLAIRDSDSLSKAFKITESAGSSSKDELLAVSADWLVEKWRDGMSTTSTSTSPDKLEVPNKLDPISCYHGSRKPKDDVLEESENKETRYPQVKLKSSFLKAVEILKKHWGSGGSKILHDSLEEGKVMR
jgi:hypothetical protein